MPVSRHHLFVELAEARREYRRICNNMSVPCRVRKSIEIQKRCAELFVKIKAASEDAANSEDGGK